jgi:isopentenyldiphosphate isomerase
VVKNLQDKLTVKLNSNKELSRVYTDKEEDRGGIYLFLSFDLANATEYKIRNYSWHKTFQDFYEDITKQIINEDSPLKNSKVWKFIGDEVLFYLKVTEKTELFKCLPYLNQVVKNVENRLENKSHYYDRLFIKTTVWIADVIDERNLDPNTANSNTKATNIIFTPPYEGNASLFLNKPDFLGFEIDLGFRISKYSHHSVIAVGAKLAYLLFKNRQLLKDRYKINGQNGSIDKNLNIIGYEALKGIWRNHKYPIVWYSEKWNQESLFLYDEHFDDEKIEIIKKKIKKKQLEKIEKLEKIFQDINQKDDIEDIINKAISSTKEINHEIDLDKVSEVHVALICLNNKKTKVLAALRPETKKRFPNVWEFGCGQISLNETFEDTAIRTYKEDFGINIKILNNAIPIATYSFTDSANQTVPGIILLGYITNNTKKIQTEKYTKTKWLSKKDINKIKNNSKKYVDDFKINALKALKVIS